MYLQKVVCVLKLYGYSVPRVLKPPTQLMLQQALSIFSEPLGSDMTTTKQILLEMQYFFLSNKSDLAHAVPLHHYKHDGHDGQRY